MNLTFDETIENHRKMWNWIADETLKRKQFVKKEEYFIQNGLHYEEYGTNCYCCQYVDEQLHPLSYRNCNLCPIKWTNNEKYRRAECCYEDVLFKKWIDTYEFNEWEDAAKYAKQIANLPARRETIKC